MKPNIVSIPGKEKPQSEEVKSEDVKSEDVQESASEVSEDLSKTVEDLQKVIEDADSEISKATDLSHTAFSHDGLIGQLEYEGFSTEDATCATGTSSRCFAPRPCRSTLAFSI